MNKDLEQIRLKKDVVVTNKKGLHLRFACGLSSLAGKFSSDITISKGRKGVNAKSMLDLVSLSAAPGTKLSVVTAGEDAQTALDAVENYFTSYQGT